MPEGEREGGALGPPQDAVVAAEPLLIVPFLTRFALIPETLLFNYSAISQN